MIERRATARIAATRMAAAGLLAATIWTAASPLPAAVAADAVNCTVKYRSVEHVYVDAGTAAGLAAGDSLVITRDGAVMATAVIEFVAARSASCRLLPGSGPVMAGDLARGPAREPPPSTAPEAAAAPRAAPPVAPAPEPASRPAPPRVSRARTSGFASIEQLHSSAPSGGNAGFNQSTLRLNLTVAEMREIYSLRMRWRARRDDRSRAASSGIPGNEWRHHLYAMSLRRDRGRGTVAGEIGRFTPPSAAGSGGLDGALISWKLARSWELAAFGGAEPAWANAGAGPSLEKFGGYVAFRGDPAAAIGLTASGAFLGEYHRGEVSRELVTLRGSLRSGRLWYASPSVVLDLDRGWRRELTGRTFSLTRMDLAAGYDPAGPFSFRAEYERYRRPRTYATRDLVPALFDDTRNEGFRAGATLGPGGPWTLGAGVGVRRRVGGGGSTWSWNTDLRRDCFMSRQASLVLSATGYSGDQLRGASPSLELRRRFAGGHDLSLAMGTYRYRAKGVAGTRSNDWMRAGGSLAVGASIELEGDYEYGRGDDLPVRRFRASLGRRF